jgi:hypothetical protein
MKALFVHPRSFFIAVALGFTLLAFPQRATLQLGCPVPFIPGYINHALTCWPESTTILVTNSVIALKYMIRMARG